VGEVNPTTIDTRRRRGRDVRRLNDRQIGRNLDCIEFFPTQWAPPNAANDPTHLTTLTEQRAEAVGSRVNDGSLVISLLPVHGQFARPANRADRRAPPKNPQ